MCDIRLLVPQSHGSDKSFHLDRLPRESLPDKCSLRHHPLPSLLFALPCPHYLEHLLFGDPANLGQRHCIFCSLIFPLLLDRGGKGLGVLLALSVQKICREGAVGGNRGIGLLDISFVVCFKSLFELNLLCMSFGV